MTTVRTVRLAIASVLAAGALLAGGAVAQHSASASIGHKIVLASPEPCCDEGGD